MIFTFALGSHYLGIENGPYIPKIYPVDFNKIADGAGDK